MGASPVVVTLGDSMKLDSGYTSETEGVGLTVGLNVKVRKGESFLFFSSLFLTRVFYQSRDFCLFDCIPNGKDSAWHLNVYIINACGQVTFSAFLLMS